MSRTPLTRFYPEGSHTTSQMTRVTSRGPGLKWQIDAGTLHPMFKVPWKRAYYGMLPARQMRDPQEEQRDTVVPFVFCRSRREMQGAAAAFREVEALRAVW